MAGENVVKLKQPIQFGSEQIHVLEFQTLKAKHLRKMPAQPGISDMLDLAGVLCAQPPSVMDELSAEDTAAVMELVGGFFAGFGGTGGKS